MTPIHPESLPELCGVVIANYNWQNEMRCNAVRGHEGPHCYTFPWIATNGPSPKTYTEAEVAQARLEEAGLCLDQYCDGEDAFYEWLKRRIAELEAAMKKEMKDPVFETPYENT